MTTLDFYWQSNKDWYHLEGFDVVLNDDAPQEAKDSYEHYLQQLKDKKDVI